MLIVNLDQFDHQELIKTKNLESLQILFNIQIKDD